jgi:hypothetical protein
VWSFVVYLRTNFLCVLIISAFPRGCEESQHNAVLSQGIIYLRVRGRPGGPAKHSPRTLADQFPGRWLLALGRWIML